MATYTPHKRLVLLVATQTWTPAASKGSARLMEVLRRCPIASAATDSKGLSDV